MSFIKLPNLPENDVSDMVVSCEISKESEYTLNDYGIITHKTQPCEILYNAVKCHPDMVFNHLGESFAVAEPTQVLFYKESLPFIDIFEGSMLTSIYPRDVAYNAARVGKYLICNKKYTDKRIIRYAENMQLEIIDVKQGYAKCNICPISEKALITSDIGIKSAVEKFPVDVLFVDDSSVLLKDFSHGFFGGATGKISADRLAVNGNIKYHKNADEIINFAKKYSVEIISLSNKYIEDIGSILPVSVK